MTKANQDVRQVANQLGDVSGQSISAASSLENRFVTPSSPSAKYSSELPHLLKYNITPTADGGVLLSIWEPAPKNEIRVKPFLFMIRYRLHSEAEARRLLSHYLSTYRTLSQSSR